MPSAAWISAASKTDRRPVLFMAVESIEAKKKAITTKEQWDASTSKTASINTTSLSGSCSIENSYVNPSIADSSNQEWWDAAGSTWFAPMPSFSVRLALLKIVSVYAYATFLETGQAATFDIYCNGSFVAAAGGFLDEPVTVSVPGQGISYKEAHLTVESPAGSYTFPANGKVTIRNFRVTPLNANGTTTSVNEFTAVALTGSFRTVSIDLETIPTTPSVFGADDTIIEGAAVAYTAYGSEDNATWTALGAVSDGSTMAPHRYYQFGVTFTSTLPESAILKEINVSGGDSQFKYFSTHQDLPVKGAKPLLKNSLGALSSKLELMKLGSTGEVSPRLFYLPATFELLRDGLLRNKAVTIRLGFEGLAEVDYEPIFSGLWHDAAIDWQHGEISVRTRTIITRFQKAQIPAERATGTTRNETSVVPKEWQSSNIITVMLDLIDYLGIPNRWINLASATAIRDGARSGDNWKVSRRLDKDNKEEALKLLEELSVLSGVFLLQDPDGKLRFKLYDPTEAIVAELVREQATFSTIDMGQAELYTRQQLYYEPRHEGDLETGNVRGAYADGADYARNDSVTLSGVTWYCLQSHKAASTTAPGTGTAHRAYWACDWVSGAARVVGDVRIGQGPLYTCKLAHTAAADNEPGRGANWRSYWLARPSKPGNSDSDYHNAYVYINADAEVAWGLNADELDLKNPGYQKKWYDKWGATLPALQALALRMDSWFANPKMKLKASELHPKFYQVRVGDMVGVTGLQLPVTGATWGVPCDKKKFMVMAKSFDPAKCTVSFDLLEV